jgi:hypothetical protein
MSHGGPVPAALRDASGTPLVLFTDKWTADVVNEFGTLAPDIAGRWIEFFAHCRESNAGKPSAKWLKTARTLMDAALGEQRNEQLTRWIDLAAAIPPTFQELSNYLYNAVTLKGLLSAASTVDDPELTRAMGRLALSAYKKFPGMGPRAMKVGNACIYALGQINNPLAVGQLAYLKVKIKLASAQKEIEKALTAAAARLNIPRDEIEEMAVPAYGLTEVGRHSETLGDFTAELTVTDSGKCELVWRKSDDKLQKSVPATLKSEYAEELKDLKAAAKDIEKMLPAQRDRIDSLFLEQIIWPLATWRERYLDHPLVGLIVRRLIWRFMAGDHSSDGIWLNNQIVNVDDDPLDTLNEHTTVELWHPIGRPMDDVLAWRGWLERHQVRQPFKQAHREVYLLTDAERRTNTYSNRFAAHVLRQHQFHALCGVRGWKNKLRLLVDDIVLPPTKILPRWGLRAEFWVEGIGDQWGTDTLDSGAFIYLATDQVRFYRIDAAEHYAHVAGGGYVTAGEQHPLNEPLPLEQIPPVVLSEILRDVDLFVGVASVGNDPTWADGGPGGRYRDYWQSVSFGDLTAPAKVRKEVLEKLIPRLKIASRCSFDDKYLVVRGDFRSYKIHLGSGNILMMPNDQYLCIVPDSAKSSGDGKVFLPFDGDRTLSIILSKALMLADDTKIKDPSIVSQIRR